MPGRSRSRRTAALALLDFIKFKLNSKLENSAVSPAALGPLRAPGPGRHASVLRPPSQGLQYPGLLLRSTLSDESDHRALGLRRVTEGRHGGPGSPMIRVRVTQARSRNFKLRPSQ